MAAEYCRLQKKIFSQVVGGKKIIQIEICTWNKKTNFFVILMRLPSKVHSQDYKKIFIFAKMVSI